MEYSKKEIYARYSGENADGLFRGKVYKISVSERKCGILEMFYLVMTRQLDSSPLIKVSRIHSKGAWPHFDYNSKEAFLNNWRENSNWYSMSLEAARHSAMSRIGRDSITKTTAVTGWR